MKKTFRLLIILMALLMVLGMSSCSENDNPVSLEEPAVTVVVEGGEDEVTESLKKAPGLVRIRKDVRTQKADNLVGVPVYYAYFTQLVDHNDPSKGTFERKWQSL